VLQIQLEGGAHLRRLLVVDDQLEAAGVHVVAQDRVAAGPLALAAGGGDLVAGAFGDDLPLERRS
jgi:hypothetical protein